MVSISQSTAGQAVNLQFNALYRSPMRAGFIPSPDNSFIGAARCISFAVLS